MTATLNRKKIHQLIDDADDAKVNAIYVLLQNELENEDVRKKLILKEREDYYNGVGKNYSFDQVKKIVKNKRDFSGL
jgi:hypothetical protein